MVYILHVQVNTTDSKNEYFEEKLLKKTIHLSCDEILRHGYRPRKRFPFFIERAGLLQPFFLKINLKMYARHNLFIMFLVWAEHRSH